MWKNKHFRRKSRWYGQFLVLVRKYLVLGTWSKTSWFSILHLLTYLQQRTPPCLPGSPAFLQEPNFLHPAVHNQGVGLTLCQSLAIWGWLLTITSSFFALGFTDWFNMFYNPSPCGRRFPGLFLIPFSFPATTEFNSQNCFLKAQINGSRTFLFGSGFMLPASVAFWYPHISFSAS